MATKRETTNNHDRLEEAITQLIQSQAVLVQNQAAFVQTQAAFVQSQAALTARMAEMDRENRERFVRIEAQMAEVIRVLNEHGRILERLPEAVREKIGFKTQPAKE
jgi:hypothetical protein